MRPAEVAFWRQEPIDTLDPNPMIQGGFETMLAQLAGDKHLGQMPFSLSTVLARSLTYGVDSDKTNVSSTCEPQPQG